MIGPVLMNLFMHYCFDRWMQEKHPYCPFARYADDAVVHCSSQLQAQWKLKAIGERLEQCGLRLNLQKTAIVYCKDSQRREVHAHKQFTFLGYTFRPRGAKNRYGKLFEQLSTRGEPGCDQEDAAHDQELEAVATNPGQPR